MKRRGVAVMGLWWACTQADAPPPAPQAHPVERVAAESIRPQTPADRDSLARLQLFAADVATAALPLTISIETLGDVATPLIPRGTPLPFSHRQVFSTGHDGQDRIEVHVLQGERPRASENRSLGKYQLGGIPAGPRGVAQVEVTIAVDRDGVLTVSGRDQATGRASTVRVAGAAGGVLDQAAIDRLLVDAHSAEEDDLITGDWTQAKRQLEQMIDASKAVLAGHGAKLPKKLRVQIQREIAAAQAITRLTTQPENPALLRAVFESLGRTMDEAAKTLNPAR